MRRLGLFLLVFAGIVALPVAMAPPAMARGSGHHGGSSFGSHPSPGPAASSHVAPPPEGATSPTPTRSHHDGDRDHDGVFFVTAFDPFYFDPYWTSYYWGPWWDRPYWASGGWYPYRVYGNLPVGVPGDKVPMQLHVHPWNASLILDGSNLGEARDFNSPDHPLWLSPGEHRLELHYPGYQVLSFKLTAEKGVPYNLHYRLKKGEGEDSRSS